MGAFTRGDIVLFPFPYTDLTNRKLRPCLTISEEMGEDIMLCQITSRRIEKDVFSIEIRNNDTIDGSLQIDSYVRANMIFTASKKQIKKRVCSISDNKYNEVSKRIYDLIKKTEKIPKD